MLSIFILIILIQQFYLTFQLKITQVTVASTVVLSCSNFNQTIESTNSAKIVWIRDDQGDIVSLDSIITVRDSRLSILTINNNNIQERNLRIENILEQDHGLYRCIQGDITLNEILLDVLIPPRIISHSPEHMHLTVREGRDARFSCIATGHPPPKIIWHVNGLSRPGITTMIDGKNESMLILRNVSRFDSGRVDCSASNTLSTVNRQFILYVKYKPIVTIPFHLRHFRLYDLATITCQVCSIPSATIFDIFRPKKPVPIMKGVKEKYDENINQTCTKLIIKIYLNESSLFGTYVCRARNLLGINYAEFTLKELIQVPKRIKYVTENRPLSTSSMMINLSSSLMIDNENKSSKLHRFTTEIFGKKNQSYKILPSILLLIFLFIIMI